MLAPPATLSTRRLFETLSPLIEDAVGRTHADRYRKSFPAFTHAWMLILHTMSGNTSLRQSHSQQGADPRLRLRLGMPKWISYSQLARSSSSRPTECFERLLCELVRHARSRPLPRGPFEALGKVAVLDSTFFSLSQKVCPWSKYKGYAPGMRLQTEMDLSRMIPASLRLTLADVNDRTALKELDLSALEGWTLVFDLGYYAHAPFERLLEGGGELPHPPPSPSLIPGSRREPRLRGRHHPTSGRDRLRPDDRFR